MATVVIERCKCCESIRRSDPFGEIVIDLVANEVIIGDKRISVVGRVAEVLALLVRRTFVSSEGFEAVFRDIDSQNMKSNINVTMHKARKALAGTGYCIKNLRGYGYAIERESASEANAA